MQCNDSLYMRVCVSTIFQFEFSKLMTHFSTNHKGSLLKEIAKSVEYSWAESLPTRWTNRELERVCYDLLLSFLFSDLSFFLVITHPSHVIGPLTTLVFVIASFHPFLWTSLTHSHLLVCTSSRFHRIPPCSFRLVIVPELSESQVYKPSTRYAFP